MMINEDDKGDGQISRRLFPASANASALSKKTELALDLKPQSQMIYHISIIELGLSTPF